MKRRALLLALPATALAQTERRARSVYRCGNTLSDRPCSADAAASAVSFDDPSRADAQAARQRARADAQQAEQLAQERERRERAAAAAPQSLSAPAPSASGAGKGKGKGKSKQAPNRTAGGQSPAKGQRGKRQQRADNQPP